MRAWFASYCAQFRSSCRAKSVSSCSNSWSDLIPRTSSVDAWSELAGAESARRADSVRYLAVDFSACGLPRDEDLVPRAEVPSRSSSLLALAPLRAEAAFAALAGCGLAEAACLPAAP